MTHKLRPLRPARGEGLDLAQAVAAEADAAAATAAGRRWQTSMKTQTASQESELETKTRALRAYPSSWQAQILSFLLQPDSESESDSQ